MIRTLCLLFIFIPPAWGDDLVCHTPDCGNGSVLQWKGPSATIEWGQPSATMWITFGGGVSVNGATGEVRIPKGMKVDEAARQFWNMVADVRHAAQPFPEAKP